MGVGMIVLGGGGGMEARRLTVEDNYTSEFTCWRDMEGEAV